MIVSGEKGARGSAHVTGIATTLARYPAPHSAHPHTIPQTPYSRKPACLPRMTRWSVWGEGYVYSATFFWICGSTMTRAISAAASFVIPRSQSLFEMDCSFSRNSAKLRSSGCLNSAIPPSYTACERARRYSGNRVNGARTYINNLLPRVYGRRLYINNATCLLSTPPLTRPLYPTTKHEATKMTDNPPWWLEESLGSKRP